MSMNEATRDNNVRPANVGATSKTAPQKTVQYMVEMKMFAVEVGDENGIKRQVMAFRVGGQWYHDPVGEQWLSRLRPIEPKAWLAQKLEERFQEATTPVAVPKQDTVDIMGG
jgi:hypothetical protein